MGCFYTWYHVRTKIFLSAEKQWLPLLCYCRGGEPCKEEIMRPMLGKRVGYGPSSPEGNWDLKKETNNIEEGLVRNRSSKQQSTWERMS